MNKDLGIKVGYKTEQTLQNLSGNPEHKTERFGNSGIYEIIESLHCIAAICLSEEHFLRFTNR